VQYPVRSPIWGEKEYNGEVLISRRHAKTSAEEAGEGLDKKREPRAIQKIGSNSGSTTY
jgi:hypothetical protein